MNTSTTAALILFFGVAAQTLACDSEDNPEIRSLEEGLSEEDEADAGRYCSEGVNDIGLPVDLEAMDLNAELEGEPDVSVDLAGPLELGYGEEPQTAIHKVGNLCAGKQAPRCVWAHVDTTNKRMRAYARIDDKHGDSRNYEVSVNELAALRWTGGKWTVVAFEPDYDGWSSDYDSVIGTQLVDCTSGGLYALQVHYQYKGHQTDHGWLVTEPFLCV